MCDCALPPDVVKPEPHVTQEADAWWPDAWNLPVGQMAHELSPPFTWRRVPAGQPQLDDKEFGPYLDPTRPFVCMPLGHGLQLLLPVESWYLLTGHGAHDAADPPLLFLPAAQLVHDVG